MFDLEKPRDSDVACTFQTTVGGTFVPLIGLRGDDTDNLIKITTYNIAVTDIASEILGKVGCWLVLGLTALSDSISVYIGPSPKEREKEERKDR